MMVASMKVTWVPWPKQVRDAYVTEIDDTDEIRTSESSGKEQEEEHRTEVEIHKWDNEH